LSLQSTKYANRRWNKVPHTALKYQAFPAAFVAAERRGPLLGLQAKTPAASNVVIRLFDERILRRIEHTSVIWAYEDARTDTHKRRPDMTEVSRDTAQIFQFPARGRYAVGGVDVAYNKRAVNFASSQVAIATLSGAWYHDEAVREAELPRQN
jgi:Protein of unknown function (DUF2735)